MGVRCKHEGCLKYSKGSECGKNEFCIVHMKAAGQKPRMVSLCHVEGCQKRAKLSTNGEKVYCQSHMREHGQDPKSSICQIETCAKEAKTSKCGHRMFCILHMRAHGQEPPDALCGEEGCGKLAQRSTNGDKLFCKAHMKARGLIPKCLRCIYPGCDKRAMYKQLMYCRLHVKECAPGMMDMIRTRTETQASAHPNPTTAPYSADSLQASLMQYMHHLTHQATLADEHSDPSDPNSSASLPPGLNPDRIPQHIIDLLVQSAAAPGQTSQLSVALGHMFPPVDLSSFPRSSISPPQTLSHENKADNPSQPCLLTAPSTPAAHPNPAHISTPQGPPPGALPLHISSELAALMVDRAPPVAHHTQQTHQAQQAQPHPRNEPSHNTVSEESQDDPTHPIHNAENSRDEPELSALLAAAAAAAVSAGCEDTSEQPSQLQQQQQQQQSSSAADKPLPHQVATSTSDAAHHADVHTIPSILEHTMAPAAAPSNAAYRPSPSPLPHMDAAYRPSPSPLPHVDDAAPRGGLLPLKRKATTPVQQRPNKLAAHPPQHTLPEAPIPQHTVHSTDHSMEQGDHPIEQGGHPMEQENQGQQAASPSPSRPSYQEDPLAHKDTHCDSIAGLGMSGSLHPAGPTASVAPASAVPSPSHSQPDLHPAGPAASLPPASAVPSPSHSQPDLHPAGPAVSLPPTSAVPSPSHSQPDLHHAGPAASLPLPSTPPSPSHSQPPSVPSSHVPAANDADAGETAAKSDGEVCLFGSLLKPTPTSPSSSRAAAHTVDTAAFSQDASVSDKLSAPAPPLLSSSSLGQPRPSETTAMSTEVDFVQIQTLQPEGLMH